MRTVTQTCIARLDFHVLAFHQQGMPIFGDQRREADFVCMIGDSAAIQGAVKKPTLLAAKAAQLATPATPARLTGLVHKTMY